MRGFTLSVLAVALLAVALSGCTCCSLAPGLEPTESPGQQGVEPPTEAAMPIPSEEAAPQGSSPGDTWSRPADGMVMVYVPTGEFQMGSTEEELDAALEPCEEYYGPLYPLCQRVWFEDESPAHPVELDGFWIDRTEVTNAQYARCVEAGACNRVGSSEWTTRDSFYGDSAYDESPVVWVSWYQAETYCAWVGARLPTEAEWEYAARGSQRWTYPWGHRFDGSRLNTCDSSCPLVGADTRVDDGYPDAAPVGSYPAGVSWCGALDLAGNVWEWVADWYGTYPSGWQVNPTGPADGGERVLRGGSWSYIAINARCASRLSWPPDFTPYDVGFRCARSPG